MSEKEIIEIIEELQCEYKEQENEQKYYDYIVSKAKRYSKGLQGLLDLYDKEKEKNAKLIDELYELKAITNYYNAIKVDNLKFNEDTKMIIADSEYFDKGYFKETFISKNKIMNKEIINGLKQRAEEMLKNDYSRKIGDEEIYTIICEWEKTFDLYNREKEKNRRNKRIALNKLEKLKNGIENDFPIKLGEQQPLWEDSYTKFISKDKIKELKQKLSIIADNEYNKYKKSTTTFVNICGICADIDDLLEE